ncbi:extracellular solute-binding protein [Kitasatospora viridis]|uniref:Carbohydrate ABC transporter substrate-binding protein (CUT1 family) n=1 Tax=Kitasatospora viridis TaxID=281105 RepID=A0A561SE11_9ACTN|nr:extracellular solute-binding protein [Kitasatospora viridis]TWF73102.1 carbohydrate ABC transporter substrate-binding protein (CUT1 family) [Kitasatospora viridis]
MPSKSPVRRTAATVLAAACALGALSACSSSGSGGSGGSAGGTTTISFMQIMNSGSQKSTLVALTDAFEKANPNIKVDLQYQPDYGTLHAKETAGVAAHNPPTIGQVYESWAAEYAKSQVILPASQFAGSDSPAGLSDFYQGVQKDLRLPDGKLWMWPFNKSVQVIFYNQDMLKAKGQNVPATWDDFSAAAKAVSGGGVTAISVDPGTTANVNGGTILFEALCAANGTPDFAANGTPQLNSPAAIKALGYLADLKKAGALAVGTNFPGETALGAQKGVFDMSSAAGYYFENQAVGGKFTLGTEVLPTGADGTKSNVLSGTNIAVFASASKAQQAAAWKYMQFLASADSQAQWSSTTGYLPVTPKALDQMGDFLAKNPYMKTAAGALDYAVAQPAFPWVAKAQGEEVVALQKVLEQGADPASALNAAQQAALADQKAGQ